MTFELDLACVLESCCGLSDLQILESICRMFEFLFSGAKGDSRLTSVLNVHSGMDKLELIFQ